jgi:hypothetical protein
MKTLCPPLLAVSLLAPALAQRVGAPTDDLTKLGVDELFSVSGAGYGLSEYQAGESAKPVAGDRRRGGVCGV